MNERDLFICALDLEPMERAAFLDRACEQDPALHARVKELLLCHDSDDPLFERPPEAILHEGTTAWAASPLADAGPRPEMIGTVIAGRYTLVEVLGEGAMGTVYRARQTEPVRREVAVKLIKSAWLSSEASVRFEAERQTLALMNHPNIARIYDGGTTLSGRPFFVMELVQGVPITEFCDGRRLPLEARLGLFVTLCQAVGHAHQKGIIHRDLKPSNVLVADVDDRPVLTVIDFGVARATEQPLPGQDGEDYRLIVGTLGHMAPEQAEAGSRDVDTRADVYALGVILYELLAGSMPLDPGQFAGGTLEEVLRRVRESEPPRPSTRLHDSATLPAVAACRAVAPARLPGLLRDELDWIVMRCLEKQCERRYETVEALARDVQRYLADEPVEARPSSRRYRLGKFVRRHKGPVLAAALVLVVLVVGIVGITLALMRAEGERQLAEQARAGEAEQREIAQVREKEAQAQKRQAVEFRDRAMRALRATTGSAVHTLLAGRTTLGANERAYLESLAAQWQAFTKEVPDDAESQATRGEGHLQTARLWDRLGRMSEAQAEARQAAAIFQNLANRFPDVAEHRNSLAVAHLVLANGLAATAKPLQACAANERAVALLETLVQQVPGEPRFLWNLTDAYLRSATVLHTAGKHEKALAAYRRGVVAGQNLVGQWPGVPGYQQVLAEVYRNQAVLLADLGKRQEALLAYQKAHDLLVRVIERFPKDPSYLSALAADHEVQGKLFSDLDRTTEAVAQWEKARAALEKRVAREPGVAEHQRFLAFTLRHLGSLFRQQGRHDDAGTAAEKARDILQKLVQQSPDNSDFVSDLARTLVELGQILAERDVAAALGVYDDARDLLHRRVTRFPHVPSYRKLLAEAHFFRAALLEKRGQAAAARLSLVEARDQLLTLTRQTPSPLYQKALGLTHNQLGMLLTTTGKRQEARDEFRHAHALLEKLAAEFPDVAANHTNLAASYCNFAVLLQHEGQFSESLMWCDRAVAMLAAVLEKAPSDPRARMFSRNSLFARVNACENLGKFAGVIEDLSKLITLCPPQQETESRGSSPRARAGQVAQAVAEAEPLEKLESKTAPLCFHLACVHALASSTMTGKKQEHADQAMRLLEAAVQGGLRDGNFLGRVPSLAALHGRDDFKKLLGDLQKR